MSDINIQQGQAREIKFRKVKFNKFFEYKSLKNGIWIVVLFIATKLNPFALLIYLTITTLLKQKKQPNKDNVFVPNFANQEYHLKLGVEVKKHLGGAVKSLAPSNQTNNVVMVNAETTKRMMSIIGTTGSGKTVFEKGMIEQQVAIGGGGFFVDGKGTQEELKNIIALVGKYGRLRDFYVVDFTGTKETCSIDTLGMGQATDIFEVIVDLLEGEEDVWKAKAKELMTNMLRLLVFRRDKYNEQITYTRIGNFNNIEPMIIAITKTILNEEQTPIDKNLVAIFRYLCTILGFNFQDEFEKITDIEKNKKQDFKKARLEDIIEKTKEEVKDNGDGAGLYGLGVALNSWTQALTMLDIEYGHIFGKEYSDINLLDAMNNNKIIWVVLPTMKSDAKAKKIGALLLGALRRTADIKSQQAVHPKVPYLVMLDEVGSYAVKGLGRLMSKTRSLGIAIVLLFQSKAQLKAIDDGKGLEADEMLDMSGTFVYLKVEDPELAELMSKRIEKAKYVTKDIRYGGDGKNKEVSYQEKEEDAITPKILSNMQDGEAYIMMRGQIVKVVGTSQTDFNLTFQKYLDADNFKPPIIKTMHKEEILRDLKKIDGKYKELFLMNKLYMYDIDKIKRDLGVN